MEMQMEMEIRVRSNADEIQKAFSEEYCIYTNQITQYHKHTSHTKSQCTTYNMIFCAFFARTLPTSNKPNPACN